MSTLAYAQITNAREHAKPGTSTTTSSPGIKSYLDVFAALVPAEILTLHALIISVTTQTAAPSAANGASAIGTVTTIPADAIGTLSFSFWALLVLCTGLFAVPRYIGGKWDKFDWIRMSIAPLAFVGWTMLQRATAFDAAFPRVGQIQRTVAALFLGAVLGVITAALAKQADQTNPPPAH